jgi:uncharacterized membrane protein SpoIIM required for sporulation
LVPSIHHLIIIEEKIERTGGKQFWAKHKTIIKSHLGAFMGILVGFLILGIINPGTLEYQTSQLQLEHLRPEIVTGFLERPYAPTFQAAFALFSHNLTYLLMGFVLSLFYGAGAIFLVIFNASYFAAFIVQIITRWAAALQLTAVSLLHLLPESAGFILTAIAGATMSRALLVEKYKAQTFKNVLQNCVKHLIIAILLILLAAFIETYITATVFHRMIT